MKYLGLTIILLLFIFTDKVYAQQVHLSIEPTVIQIDATPPARFETPFTLRNLSNSTAMLTPLFIPIEPKEDGKVSLLLDEQENLDSVIKDRLSIVDEQGVVSEIELRAGETKQLRLFMNTVSGDPVGDYYFSVVFIASGTILDNTSTSTIPAGIAMNILVSLGPKVDASATIEEFSTKKIVTSGPIFFNLKMHNTGRHLIQPEGNIVIRNMFGKQVGNIEILPQYVLAYSSRYLLDSNQASPSGSISNLLSETNMLHPVAIWDEQFLMGRYTAEANLILEEGGSVVSEKVTFFAIPIKLLVITSGIVFIVLGVLLKINYKMRKKSE